MDHYDVYRRYFDNDGNPVDSWTKINTSDVTNPYTDLNTTYLSGTHQHAIYVVYAIDDSDNESLPSNSVNFFCIIPTGDAGEIAEITPTAFSISASPNPSTIIRP